MAAVRLEERSFSDKRFDRLALEAGLTDADHARGKMAQLWRQCTEENRYVLDERDIQCVLGAGGVAALIASRLGEVVDTGVRICGTNGRIEWLAKCRAGGQGGAKFGKKGGRPRKPRRGFLETPSQEQEQEQ